MFPEKKNNIFFRP